MKFFTPTKLSENMHKTPEGFLVCVGVPITRTGILEYGEGETPLETDIEGKILISRDEDDVFHVDTIASFEGKAVTIEHPQDFITPENWSYLAKGTVQNVRRGEGDDASSLIADLLITDATAIALVENGLREVSCGYEAEYLQTGEGKGRQRKIIGNHVALVERGRAGREHRINDHERKVTKMSKLKEKLLSAFSKTVDEAMKEDKAKDESTEATPATLEGVMALLKKLEEQMGSSSQKKDVPPPATDAEKEEPKKDDKKDAPKKDAPKKEDEAKDEGEEESKEMSLAELTAAIKQMQASINKLLNGDDEDEDEDEESESEDSESEDDDFEESGMTGDTSDAASRAEILAPGIAKNKDMKVNALKSCYATKDGKKIIESLNGGKAPTFDNAQKTDMLFVAASELMKQSRTKQMSTTKKVTDSELDEHSGVVVTPAMINEANRVRYGQK